MPVRRIARKVVDTVSNAAGNVVSAVTERVKSHMETRELKNNMIGENNQLVTHGGVVEKDAGELESMKDDFLAERNAAREEAWEAFKEENDIEGEMFIPERYLVRGANLYCSHGSHVRKLNLPKCHGVYITREPMVHELDCIPGDTNNISTFGICEADGIKALTPKPPTLTLKLAVYDDFGNKKETDEDLGNITGTACMPMIAGGKWLNTYDKSRIVDNGDKDPGDKDKDNNDPGKGYPAVTTESFLICTCGGIIEPISCGQNNIEVGIEDYEQ